jgi:AcrR family transcriptional regulator
MPKNTFHNLPDAKRERILAVALEEFANNSYQNASISKIVKKAGIPKGSIYQYFDDKQAIFRYLIEYATEEKLAFFSQLASPDPASDLFGYLRWLFQAQVQFELNHPKIANLLYHAFLDDTSFPDMIEELQRRGSTQFFKQLLTQGILHGSVSPWVDPDIAAFILEKVFYQLGRYFITRLRLTQENLSSEAVLETHEAQALLTNLMDILEAGMKQNPDQRNRSIRPVNSE